MLDKVKLALRISTNTFDSEIQSLINAGLMDLEIAGIDNVDQNDELIRTAVITYVKLHFGEPTNYNELKTSYDEQKAQLQVSMIYRR